MESGIFGACGNVGGEKPLNTIKSKSSFKKKSTKYSRNQKVLTYENVCTCLRNEYLGDSYKFLALLTGDASEGSMVLVVRVDNSAVCC